MEGGFIDGKMVKESGEFKEILKALEKWHKKNKGNITAVGSFFSYDKEHKVKNDLVVAYGPKSVIKTMLNCLNEELKKEKKDFVTW